MYNGAVDIGVAKAGNSALKTLILGFISGCHIAFGAYLVLSVGGACPEIAKSNPGLQKIISGAFGLPFGLMMTVVGGGELFTGNTCLVTMALLENKIKLGSLAKNWFYSYLGNFLGSLFMAYMAYVSGTLGAGPASVAAAIAKTSLPLQEAFVRGILCNFLVCMAVYMSSGASSLASKMVGIFFPISAFIALGLEHSVANMFLVPLGMLRGADVSIKDFLLKCLLPVTLGNVIGGAVCVAAGYSAAYGSLLKPHEKGTQEAKLLGIRGGFAPKLSPRNINSIKNFAHLKMSTTESKKTTGTDYLPENAKARAAEGNMFEKVKLKKDGSSAWDDIYEYAAAIRAGTMNWEDIASDDIDIRVKYAGMFHRKKMTPGKFMLRMRVPNGIVNSQQMRYFAKCVRPAGPDIGVVDITTRANVQLRGLSFEESADVVKGLGAFGLSSLQSGLDNLRNMVGSPLAGIDPLEQVDTRALCKEIDDWYTNKGQGNLEYANLPRKFNIAISGSRDDFAHTSINDIGFRPCAHQKTGEMGFNVVIGGYFSIKRAAEAVPLGAWVSVSDASVLSRAILRIFRDDGPRGDRQKTRLMWLVEQMGMPAFRDAVEKEMRAYKGILLFKLESQQEDKDDGSDSIEHRDILGVHPQKQGGKSWVGVHVPVGRLSADECDEIASLADKYSAGEIRLTVDQNVIFPNVDSSVINAMLSEPIFTKPGSRLGINPGHIVGHVVSCTGAQFCGLALVETKLKIDALTRKLQTMVEVPRAIRIHMTGCPNSCGQAQIADIGLMGAPAKKADATGAMKAVPGVNIFVGGKIGHDAFLALEPEIKGIPMTEEDLLPVLSKILVDKFGATVK